MSTEIPPRRRDSSESLQMQLADLAIDPLEFEEFFSNGFGRPIIPCIVTEPLAREDLSETEIIQLAQFKNERRKLSWLRGRRALKILLRDLEFVEQHFDFKMIDTSATFFPHPAFSLSHSQDVAIAIACLAPAFGVGIDLEFVRPTKPQMSKFYLQEHERTWLQDLSNEERSCEQIRLWTVKEAVFKSDLNNLDRTLIKYSLADPRAETGKASVPEYGGGTQEIEYKSKRFGNAWITIAISYGEQNSEREVLKKIGVEEDRIGKSDGVSE
ncbi:MAG: 4'-phosphopantetheinyl transferase superfamily protein [Candidatus Obscuribacterales bacterium]|nr:4'-phosphopantetheinyl transferase superfamily protein [Candidatus Obscuribacterales bacterium]